MISLNQDQIKEYIPHREPFLFIDTLIEIETDSTRLSELESEVNELVKNRNLKVYHGLVLRNAIELRENELSFRGPNTSKLSLDESE